MPAESLRSRYVALLLDRLSEARYPSAPMLERIEAAIGDRDQAVNYVSELLDKIEEETYPSPQMLSRLETLISIVEAKSA